MLNDPEKQHIREQITTYAKEVGFDLVGFSPAKIDEKYLQPFQDWLKNGHHGTMNYMEKIEARSDLSLLLPNAKSVIVLAKNYYRPQPKLSKNAGRIARYAYGRDYHKIIKKNLKQLEKFIQETFPTIKTRSYVDTGPILERALAEQAGIGEIGKNTCLITKEFGSWVFLSEIIIDADLTTKEITTPTTPPQIKETFPNFTSCMNCRKCIDSCPTGAIIAPGIIDARLCISYLTIENKDSIPPDLAAKIKDAKLLYGCDICQEVCPHNHTKQKITTHPSLTTPKIAGDELPLSQITSLTTPAQFISTFAGSPLTRAKLTGLKRNAKVLEG